MRAGSMRAGTSRKERLSESTTRPLESSESRELAVGDRAPWRAMAGQPLEAVAIIDVDEAIGVERVRASRWFEHPAETAITQLIKRMSR